MRGQEQYCFKSLFGPLLFLVLAISVLVEPARGEECANMHKVLITFEDATGFKPETVVIQVGDCVRWINDALIDHSVVAEDRSFRVGMLQRGADGIVVFNEPGVFPYFCGPHPPMKGKVIVEPVNVVDH